MKFRNDTKYVVAQTLKAAAGYLIGLSIVLLLFDLEDKLGFGISSLFADILLYCLLMPRAINIKGDFISFVTEHELTRREIELSDIADVQVEKGRLYDTVVITTKSGEKYRLHPADKQAFRDALTSHNE